MLTWNDGPRVSIVPQILQRLAIDADLWQRVAVKASSRHNLGAVLQCSRGILLCHIDPRQTPTALVVPALDVLLRPIRGLTLSNTAERLRS